MLDVDRIRYIAQKPPSTKDIMPMESPQRERGLWSFLTWSFFIAQHAIGNAFAGGAAQAANGLDSNALGSADSTGVNAKNALAPPDFRAFGNEDPQSPTIPGPSAPAHDSPSATGSEPGGIERLDPADDASSAARSLAMQGSGASEGGAIQPDVPPDAGPGIELPPDIGVPPALEGLLPPILGTVDDLVDALGPTLDGLLTPVVETVEDLAGALGPILDQVLSPVEALVENTANVVEPTLELILNPLENMAEGVGELVEPIGDGAGQILALADPAIDAVEPILSPVMDIADAAQPILAPVLDVAAPVLDVLQPVVEPILEILPLGLGNDSPLGGVDGSDGLADAMGSPGEFQFVVHAGPAGYELFQAGAYTEFGLTMHGAPSNNEIDAGDLLGNLALPIEVVFRDDEDGGNGPPALFGHLQDEAGLRGLGDGLI